MTKSEWHMANAKRIVRIIAFVQNDDGTESVFDIVDTCPHYAYRFFSQFVRAFNISKIMVGTAETNYAMRTIHKGQGK